MYEKEKDMKIDEALQAQELEELERENAEAKEEIARHLINCMRLSESSTLIINVLEDNKYLSMKGVIISYDAFMERYLTGLKRVCLKGGDDNEIYLDVTDGDNHLVSATFQIKEFKKDDDDAVETLLGL